MNTHFKDAWYHLRHAGSHLGRGLREELQPAERKARELTGRERPPEPSRREKMRRNIRGVEHEAKRRSRDAVRDARKRMS
ncbi:hypothetical protein A4G99_13820 [Haladaptatus sp. R4]|uniref:DUF7553 family protein n=1 Tax=Haladaptatus sp. R4 TaxID=1679489 RepID=UPI0007B4B445|nr:hypothetical protein [Haladaptatus sp. R4]KZN23904.1 hypothetical protein A4G99_13820 [Haladaptatus sp. R4]